MRDMIRKSALAAGLMALGVSYAAAQSGSEGQTPTTTPKTEDSSSGKMMERKSEQAPSASGTDASSAPTQAPSEPSPSTGQPNAPLGGGKVDAK